VSPARIPADVKAVSAQPTTLPPILRQAWLLMLAGVVISTAMHLYWFLVQHLGGFYAWPLSPDARDRFNDFMIFRDKYTHWHQPDFFSVGFPINYPAPIADLFEFFFHFFRYPTVAFMVFLLLSFVVPCVLFARALRARGLRPVVAASFSLSAFLFSWPVLLLIDRANMEVTVWVVTALGFWAFATGRKKTAAVCFGLAGAFKLFPFVLLALFFSEKKWKALLIGVVSMAVSSVVSLWILGPTILKAWAGISFGLASFKMNYMAQWHGYENGVDHSLFAFIKFALIVTHLHKPQDFYTLLSVYLTSSAIGGLALYFLRIRFLPLVNQALLLTISCIYLTAFSGDGTLIHLYALFAMMAFIVIDAWKRKLYIPRLQTMFLILTFIVTPTTFLIFKEHRFEGEVKCVALSILSYLALRYPIGPPLFAHVRPDALAYPDTSLMPNATPESR
jgi:hypothetical protein